MLSKLYAKLKACGAKVKQRTLRASCIAERDAKSTAAAPDRRDSMFDEDLELPVGMPTIIAPEAWWKAFRTGVGARPSRFYEHL